MTMIKAIAQQVMIGKNLINASTAKKILIP